MYYVTLSINERLYFTINPIVYI